MANPEGYQARLMKMAEKFIPVLTLIDTRAYPGLEARTRKVRLSPEIYLKWYV
jgi:acetyl-CoA carboxylase alpha subunit